MNNIWHDIKKELPADNMEVALLGKHYSIFYGVASRNGEMRKTVHYKWRWEK